MKKSELRQIIREELLSEKSYDVVGKGSTLQVGITDDKRLFLGEKDRYWYFNDIQLKNLLRLLQKYGKSIE